MESPGQAAIDAFLAHRERRPLLRDILLPESALEVFLRFHKNWDEEAAHRSLLLLAHENDELDGLCRPLEKFIYDWKGGPDALTPQYRSDLVESWYDEQDADRRQKRFNKLQGKVFEFHVASFFQSLKWQVTGMEAFSGPSCADIECLKGETTISLSCKTLCQSPEMFQLSRDAVENNGVAVHWVPVYGQLDYLLFRLTEGAWSLRLSHSDRKVVVLVLVHEENFHWQLGENWIDFDNPMFFDKDQSLTSFWEKHPEKRKQAEELFPQLPTLISGIIILQVGENFALSVTKQHWYVEPERSAEKGEKRTSS